MAENAAQVVTIPPAQAQSGVLHAIVAELTLPPALAELLSPLILVREPAEGWACATVTFAGIAGSPGAAHYGAAKAGVINLARSLALEWAPAIRVNCVAPDFIRTEGTERLMTDADRERIAVLIPLRRVGAPEDVANAVAFLISDMAAFVTGQTLVVDGGSLYRSRLDFVTDQ